MVSYSIVDPRGPAEHLNSMPIAARLKAAEQAVNPLLEAARILLRAIAETPEVLEAGAVAWRRQWLEHEVRLFTRVCGELRLRHEHVRSASYCLCSALDEAAMKTNWGRGETTGVSWEMNSLAAAFGDDRQGGDRVFQLIDEALSSPREHLDLIEVFQNILDLGFRGRYRFERGGRQRLRVIHERVHDVVITGGLCADRTDRVDRVDHAGEPMPMPLPRRMIDPWVRRAVVRRSRWWICAGLALATLLGAGGFAAADHWARARHAQPQVSAVELLTRRLEDRLRDEIAAGNAQLIRDVGHDVLTVRFSGMFIAGDATVAPWGASMVAAAGREIAAHSEGTNVLVTGYADSMPASAARQGSNQALSEARGRQVAQILVAAGVPMQRVSVTGKGDADPLANNATVRGRARNRRVEVVVSRVVRESAATNF